MFREANAIEIEDEDNELIQRLDGLSEGLEKLAIKKRDNSINIVSDVKQVIWFCLSGSSDLYNEKAYSNPKSSCSSDENKYMIFNKSPQIISFFKYLFAIKPKMQFNKLEKKFVILIECKNEYNEKNIIAEYDVSQIYFLFDWLNFAGCSIPLAIYTKFQVDKNLRMSLQNNYISIRFINDLNELDNFLNLTNNFFSPKNTPMRGIGLNKNAVSEEDETSDINSEPAIKTKNSTNNTLKKNNISVYNITGNSSENTSKN